MERKNAWNTYGKREISELEELNSNYIDFLSDCKTERECVKETVRQAREKGYKSLEEVIEKGQPLKQGDKVYAVCMNKTVALFNIGKIPMEQGMNILGAHIDSPRMDIKQNPLYESNNMAYLDTHYYGGIKKYQWVTLPLAIHGVVVKKDGTKVEVNIGEKDTDPVFCVTDLLIHLAGQQMEKNAAKVIEGENLDILVGSIPLEDKEKDAVKEGIIGILKNTYEMEEEDFMSAELEVVPAGRAREMGFDRSMIMAYGQDDKVCAYTSLAAMLETDKIDKTACCLLVDKEEIGSVGATGMQSKFFENTVAELLNLNGDYNELKLKRCLAHSRMLSSDVNAAFDPLYSDVFKNNSSSFLGSGVVFNKFTGSRGKSGSNDANAEYLAVLRNIMDNHNVHFQMSELGKIDAGGGGTIAYIMSLYGMEVIDCGVAVLNMHAPWEVTSKADIYETYKCYKAFLKNA
ncbi:aminopeptidase [Eubacterium ventriosum]|uniref:M18 family aminopeptidase n=1 Tax=Eubacterium ventriosum TaxID=39496 RepID=A0A414R540_9FIRM|nr:aminopeptidase [Eubacterium ventriosum]RHF88146.1 aminopeptidase [Eubacterium ventriosum]